MLLKKTVIVDQGAPTHLDPAMQPVVVVDTTKQVPAPDPKPSVPHEPISVPTKFEAPVVPVEHSKKASTIPPPDVATVPSALPVVSRTLRPSPITDSNK